MSGAVLAIDVTGPGGGAALVIDGRADVRLIPPAVARGRDLVPQIQELLAAHGVTLGSLAGIACAVGPGSFTGIRIGIATAATLAYAAGLPVAAIGSMHGIAAPHAGEDVCVALDARREHVYAARFRGGRLDGGYRHVPATELATELNEATTVVGDARTKYPALFGSFAGTEESTVHPESIAELGANAFARGESIAAEELRPLYLRLSDPELRRHES